jgi:CDP-glycerol glycerophosphotransferase (TagB/SpsB family)
MTEQEIFKKEAENGYTVCFAEQCPLKEQCLHYLVGQQMPDTRSFYHCVNPRYQDVGTERCSLFRSSKKVKFAKGMMHIFNADMPRRVEPFVRQRLIGKHCRTYYYEYRNGTRLISPAIQEEVRSLFREAGWKEEVHFDSYVEDYEW